MLSANAPSDHSQHLALIKTCEECMAGSAAPVLLVFYAHHRYALNSLNSIPR